MTAITALLAPISCGVPGAPAPPPEVPQTRQTEILEAVFEERDSSGRLLWTLVADTVVETTPDDFRCTAVRLEIIDPSGSGLQGIRSLTVAGSGTRLSSGRGRIRRSGEATIVTLEEGYIMTLTSGWTANGRTLEWDGALLTSPERIEMKRGNSVIRGERSVIDPQRNRITLYQARGEFEGLEL